MGAFALFTALLALLTGGLFSMKALDQRYRDLKRKTYRLTFPQDLDAERVVAWVRSISGTLRGRPGFLLGVPTIAFEMRATNKGITHRLKVPWQHTEYVIPQLHSLIPGIGVAPEEEFPSATRWTRAVEVGLTTTSRQLNIYSPADTAASLLASVQALGDDEELIMQWVVTPAVPKHKPVHKESRTHELSPGTVIFGTLANRDEVEDRRRKLEEPNLLAVLRVGAKASTSARAEHLVYRVRSALASTRGPSTRFVKRFIGGRALQRRLEDASGVVNFPIQLSAPELAALIAWPIGNPFVAGLPAYVTRRLPAPESVPQEGRVIGRSTYPGRERRIAVSYQDALKHVHFMGPTGCLHPDTPIFDPVDGSTKTVKQRFEDGVPFHVFAKHGTKLVCALASPPVEFHKVSMFELYNDEHQVVVTGQHRVWNGQDYVEVEKLYRQQKSAQVRLPSISDDDLSKLLSDAQHLMQRHGDSRDGCPACCRLCGPRPHEAGGSGLMCAPSRGGAHEPCWPDFGADDRARRREHSHHDHKYGHPASHSSCRPYGHGPWTVRRLLEDICLLSSWLHLMHGKLLVHSNLTYTARRFDGRHRGVLGGEDGRLARYRADCISDVLLGAMHRFGALSLRLRNRLAPFAQPYDACVLPTSSLDILFNSYFKNSIFSIRPANAETYYDFHVPVYENYLAEGLIHHNSGKTAALAQMFRQDIEKGFGAIVMEPKGDLFELALNYVPRERANDVIVLDLSDGSTPLGFNLLEQGDQRAVIDEIADIIKAQYSGNGIWTDLTLYHGLRTIAAVPGLTLMDLPAILMPVTDEEVDWREGILRGLNELELRSFWQRIDKEGRTKREQITQPAWDRLQLLASRPEIRNILGQSKSSFNMADVVRQNKILLVNLSGVPKESASLMGTLLFNSLWHNVPRIRPDKPNFLYLDEFQSFLNLPVDQEDMLAKARGFGLGMVLAHQHLGQLTPDLKRAVLANARTKVVFQTSADDARTMDHEFGQMVSEQDFLHLGRYEALARIATGDGVSQPLTLATFPPAKGYGGARAVRQMSREAYGRPVKDVEAEISARRHPDKVRGGKPPKLASDLWGSSE